MIDLFQHYPVKSKAELESFLTNFALRPIQVSGIRLYQYSEPVTNGTAPTVTWNDKKQIIFGWYSFSSVEAVNRWSVQVNSLIKGGLTTDLLFSGVVGVDRPIPATPVPILFDEFTALGLLATELLAVQINGLLIDYK